MNEITVLSGDDLEAPDGTFAVSWQVAFETEDSVMIRSRIAGGITTDWHHNGDRHVYGYVVRGEAMLEYGMEDVESAELAVGDFVYVPPRTIRRVMNPTDQVWGIVIRFVGSRPPAVIIDRLQSADE